VPGAQIRVRSGATNEMRSTLTSDQGQFTVANLAPGLYEVTCERAGFKKLVESGIELFVDQTARLALTLHVGETSEAITVTTTLPPLNTENGTKGDVIVSQEMLEMPLNGRNFADLAFLVPGVAPKALTSQVMRG